MAEARIGKAELEVLAYIQDHHPINVREVAEHFSRTKGHVRTTTLNVMGRLVVKGYLRRKRVDGIYLYEPRQEKGELLRRLVGDFVHGALGGSLSPFVAFLAEDGRLSDREVSELRRVIDRLENSDGESKP